MIEINFPMEIMITLISWDFDDQVEERDVPVEELLDAEEVFLTGTAVVVNPVSSITYKGKRYTDTYTYNKPF